DTSPQFRRIEPEALRLYFVAKAIERQEHWAAALDSLRRVDSLQVDRLAAHFLGRIGGLEAWCLGATGRLDEAEPLARRTLATSPDDADAHLTLAAIANGRSEWQEAIAQLDTLLA